MNMPDGNVSVSLQNATARWIIPEPSNAIQNPLSELKIGSRSATLSELHADFHKGELIGIIGSVGAGKSSLLEAILRELPLESGAINVNGTISYASQEPWLFAGTVRQNILFGQEFEWERYNMVVRACALTTDFEQLPDGDRTVVGERGISLSGGQKARVK